MLKRYAYKLKGSNLHVEPVIYATRNLRYNKYNDNLIQVSPEGDLIVFGRETGKRREKVEEYVAWKPTLRRFINLANLNGIEFDIEPSKDKVIYVKNNPKFDGSDEGSRCGVEVGADQQTKFDMAAASAWRSCSVCCSP